MHLGYPKDTGLTLQIAARKFGEIDAVCNPTPNKIQPVFLKGSASFSAADYLSFSLMR